MFYNSDALEWQIGVAGTLILGRSEPTTKSHCPGDVDKWYYLFDNQKTFLLIENSQGENDRIYCADNDSSPNCCDILQAEGLDDMDGYYYREKKFGFD